MEAPTMARGAKELLTVTEAARRLGVSPNTLRSWVADKKIDAVVLPSGHRRFQASVVEEKRREMGFKD